MYPRSRTPRRKPAQGGMHREEMGPIAHLQIRVLDAVDRHVGDDPDAESLADVLFDDVGVPGGQPHWRYPFFGEQLEQR